jgi:hypothetical protein
MNLRTAKERIIPYLLVMIFYFWMWHVFNNLNDPPITTTFFLGSFLALLCAWFFYIFFKITMYTVYMFFLLLFVLLFSLHDNYAYGYISELFLIAGIVCTSGLLFPITPFEIYSGLAIGMLAQFVHGNFKTLRG